MLKYYFFVTRDVVFRCLYQVYSVQLEAWCACSYIKALKQPRSLPDLINYYLSPF